MKEYLFSVHNWKSSPEINKPFWLRKRFPSAYAAAAWADRMSFGKTSPYMVVFCAGMEREV